MQLVKSIHKWASLLVGIQFLLWLVSGLYFNIMDHEKATGRVYLKHIHETALIEHSNLVEPQLVLQKHPASQSVKLIQLLNKPYYLLTHKTALYRHFKNEYSLVDAYTGELKPIDEHMAIELAKLSYSGPGSVVNATKLSPPFEDIPREKNDVWRVNFDDQIHTSVYIEAGSGRLVSHSNDDKRFADIFFMLHFMDYGSKGDFNSWQIIIFALVTLWLAFTGLIWTIELWRNGDYRLGLQSRKWELKVIDSTSKNIGKFKLPGHLNILDGLVDCDIALPSSCGGGGTCGQCKIKLNKNVKITSADKHHFSESEIEEGMRLACQHKCDEAKELSVFNYTQAKKRTLILTQSKFLSPFIKELRFKLEGDLKLAFKAGAYMRFFVPEAKGFSVPKELPEAYHPHWQHVEHLEFEHLACSRSYSLANYDTQTDELVFTIKIQSAPSDNVLPGIGSNYLCNLKAGESIEAVGPFEEFYAQPDSNKDMILIGAGAGMAPLRSLIYEQLEKYKSNRQMHFYFGARNSEELIYSDEFERLSETFSNFHYHPVLSRADDTWNGYKGYVQEIIKSDLDAIDEISNLEFYLCGPKQMMVDNISLLQSKGIKDDAIAFDDFNPG